MAIPTSTAGSVVCMDMEYGTEVLRLDQYQTINNLKANEIRKTVHRTDAHGSPVAESADTTKKKAEFYPSCQTLLALLRLKNRNVNMMT